MEFIKLLFENEESKKLKDLHSFGEGMTFRMLDGIQINDLTLSIQASYGHHCSPRKTFNDLSVYDTMEFALLGSSGAFLTVTDVLPTFSRLEEIEKHEDTVYSFVPVDLINQLYLELARL